MEIKKPEDYELIPDKLQPDSETIKDVEKDLKFELKAQDFLTFAEEDIKGEKDKDLVNALSNIKRAIENRIDTIFFIFGYSTISKDWNFPAKIDQLNNLNIVAPRILVKINRIRNLLEHEYQLPNREEVETALDVAILFLESTKIYLKKFFEELEYYDEERYLRIKFKNYCKIKIEIFLKKKKEELKYTIDAKNPNYDDWIRFIIKLVY